MLLRVVFVLCLLVSASGYVSPPVALVIGLLFCLLFTNPFPAQTRKVSKILLQASVVGLGFGMNLHEVLRAGRSGFVYTLLGISFAMCLGMALGALFQVRRRVAFLI